MLASLHPPGVYSHFFLPKAPDPVPGALPGSQWVPGAAQIPGKGSPGAQGGPGAAVYSLQSPRGQVLAAPKQHKILGKIPMQLQRHLPAWAWQELLLIPKSHLEGENLEGFLGAWMCRFKSQGPCPIWEWLFQSKFQPLTAPVGDQEGFLGSCMFKFKSEDPCPLWEWLFPNQIPSFSPPLDAQEGFLGCWMCKSELQDPCPPSLGCHCPLPAGHPGMWFGISGAGMWPRSSPTIQVWFLG